jgi:hypothetical protein
VVGDLVLRLKQDGHRKLESPWVGPYIVTEALAEGALGPDAEDGTLGLFLLPTGRLGRRFTRADDEATAVEIEALFLLPRGRPRPRFSTRAPMFRRDPSASAMELRVGKKKP